MFQDIFNYYSIIVEVYLDLRGFTIFVKSSLPLHLVASEKFEDEIQFVF